MAPDIRRFQAGVGVEGGEQALQGGDLPVCRCGFLEIADKADAEAEFVRAPAAEMSAGKLFLPALAGVYFPVSEALAVADQEMIGEAVGHFPLDAMVAVDPVGSAAGGGGMSPEFGLPAPVDNPPGEE